MCVCKAEVDVNCLLSSVFFLYNPLPLMMTGSHQFGWAGWPVSSRDPLCLCSYTYHRVTGVTIVPRSYMYARDLNSGTFKTEPCLSLSLSL